MQPLTPDKSLVEKVYDTILNALCDGTFRPGERLTQEDIAQRLSVSRQPVMQALILLKSQGLVEARGRQGVTVVTIDRQFLRDIYQLRAVIEPLAVELACKHLSADVIERGNAIIGRGKQAVVDGDHAGALQADIDFHRLIHDGSGNALIVETMTLYWNRLRLAMSQIIASPGMTERVWAEHAMLFEQMVNGSGQHAAALMRYHLLGACERLEAEMPLLHA